MIRILIWKSQQPISLTPDTILPITHQPLRSLRHQSSFPYFSLSHIASSHTRLLAFTLARPQVQPSGVLKHNGNGDILTLIFLTIKYTLTTQESNSNIFRAFNEPVSLVRSQIQPNAGGYILTIPETIQLSVFSAGDE